MRLVFVLCTLSVLLPAGPGFDEAQKLYLKGVEGDRSATRQSEKLFETLSRHSPDDPLVIAYLGSIRILESGRTWALWKKGKLAKDGLEALDKAVEIAPDHPEVRFLRAVSTFHLPNYFQREKQCADDLARIAPRVADAAASGRMNRRMAAAALYYHGLVLEKQGNRGAAEEAWKAAGSLAPESRAAADAARKLKGA